MTDQIALKNTVKKPRQQAFFYPDDPATNSRPLYKPNIAHVPDCSQWIDLKTANEDSGISGLHSQLCNLPESRKMTSGLQEFPSVPQVLY